jgi:cobalt-zinc-cadmium efflux system outer membrane protein
MYRQAIALSVGLSFYVATAWPQASSSALTPDQLVEAAIARNRDFLSLKQRITAAQGLLKQAGVGPADAVELSGLSGQPFGNNSEDNFTAVYSHTFETFGKRSKRGAVAQKEVALAQAEFAERRRELSFEVKTQYAEATSEQLKLAVIERLLGVNREYLRLTEARLQRGDVAPLEADLLRVELNRDEARLALIGGRLRSAVLELKTSLDISSTDALSLASSLTPPSFENALPRLKSFALANRPDLLEARIGEEQSAAQTALAKVEAKPNLTLSGQYSHVDSAFDQFGLTQSGTLTPLRSHDD